MGRRSLRLGLVRLTATATDILIGGLLGLALANTRVGFFFAGRAAVMLSIGSAETIWKGPVPMILGILGPLVYGLPFAMLLVLLLEPLTGASPGKRICGLRLVRCDHASLSRGTLWYRTAIKSMPCWGLVAALLTGSWMLALCFAVIGAAQILNSALAVFSTTRPFHDALSRTCCIRTRAEREPAP